MHGTPDARYHRAPFYLRTGGSSRGPGPESGRLAVLLGMFHTGLSVNSNSLHGSWLSSCPQCEHTGHCTLNVEPWYVPSWSVGVQTRIDRDQARSALLCYCPLQSPFVGLLILLFLFLFSFLLLIFSIFLFFLFAEWLVAERVRCDPSAPGYGPKRLARAPWIAVGSD
ncbi:hypothetical protein BDW72DRAFT_54476 [Aspergillus terricola var. indicus]